MSEKQAMVLTLALMAASAYFTWIGPLQLFVLPAVFIWPIVGKFAKHNRNLYLVSGLFVLVSSGYAYQVSRVLYESSVETALSIALLAGVATVVWEYLSFRKRFSGREGNHDVEHK